jgi:hypothetical protein
MIPPSSKRFGGFLAVLAILLAIPGFAAGTEKAALLAVRVPGSDLEIMANAEKSQKSEFQKKMEVLQKELEKDMDPEALAASKKLENFLKNIGIEKDGVKYIVGSLSIRGIDTQAEVPKVPGLIAFSLKAPISADKIAEGVTKAAAEEGEAAELEKSSYKGVPTLALKLDPANLPAGMDAAAGKAAADLCVALPADGLVVYFGQTAEVKAGIDRMLAGTGIAPSTGLKAAKALVPADADGYIIFDMPDRFRETLSQFSANLGHDPMMAGFLSALAGLKGASLSGVTTDKASVALSGDFETNENATIVKTTIDGRLAGPIFMAKNMNGGKSLNVLDSLKTEAKGTTFTLSFEITVQDIRDIVEFSNRMKKQAAGGPGGMPPGAPAPGGVPAP